MGLLTNPYAHLKAAASGDLEALRALADHSIELTRHACADPVRALQEGLIFARMAAAVGTICDKGRVLGMLALCGECANDYATQMDCLAEGIAMASIMADHGEELAADGVNLLSEGSSPEVLELAKVYELILKDVY